MLPFYSKIYIFFNCYYYIKLEVLVSGLFNGFTGVTVTCVRPLAGEVIGLECRGLGDCPALALGRPLVSFPLP